MTSITLTREMLTAFARIDNAGLSHMQRIDAMAKAIGFETGASLSSTLKAAEKSRQEPAIAKPADAGEKPYQAVVIWDPKSASDYLLGEIIEDETKFNWSLECFNSAEELNAYMKGILDGCGWESPFIAEDTGAGHTPFIKACREDPNLSLADWHNERMTEDLGDDDLGTSGPA